MQYTTLKVYGERNTGTNYLRDLIGLNLSVQLLRDTMPYSWAALQLLLPGKEGLPDFYFQRYGQENLGWKHCLPPQGETLQGYAGCTPETGFITLTKNPYSWLLSLHRRPYHYQGKTGSFDDFIRAPWKTVGREWAPQAFPNPIALWNAKNRAYIALRDTLPCLNLSYEALLDNPAMLLEEIGTHFELPRKSDQFRNKESSTKLDRNKHDDYRAYYLEEQWRSKLSTEQLAWINAEVDQGLMAAFGYDVINP